MKTKTLIYFAVILSSIALIEARGGRGGGRGGGRFSSRSRSRYRSSSRSRSKYRSSSRSASRSKFSGNRISSKGQLRTAILIGTVYGATRWINRYSYQNDNELPEVCYNDKYDKAQDGNSTYLGRFLCPTDGSMRGDMCYCCGVERQQYCCTFWGDGGRVAGVVLGVLVLVAIVFTTCYCCVNKGSPRSTSFLRTPSKNEYQLAQT